MATTLLVVVMMVLSSAYLRFAWDRYEGIAASRAITLAKSLGTLIPHELVAQISGSVEDLGNADYMKLRNNLMRLVASTDTIRFAYLLGNRDGHIIILMDSASPDSVDYSPPGQVYTEASDADWVPFRTAESVLSNPVTDRWGTWISALVPILDANGVPFAVFGIDYSASTWYADLWKQIIPDLIVVACVIILCLAFVNIRIRNTDLKRLNERVTYDEALYRSIFSQAPIGIAIVSDDQFVSQSEYGNPNINPMFEKILARSSKELALLTWPDITHPDDLQADLDLFERFRRGETSGYSMEKRFLRPDGSSVWTAMKISPLQGLRSHAMHLCLLEDITMRNAAAAALGESERSKSVLLSHLPGLAYRCRNDEEWTMQYVSIGCMALTGYPAESLLNNAERSFSSIIAPEYRQRLQREWVRILSEELPFKYEYEIVTANNSRKWVLEMGQGVKDNKGQVEALEGIIIDISDRKQMEEELRYNNEHDTLTGLYNRRYLETLLADDATLWIGKKRAAISVNLTTVQSLTTSYGFHHTQALLIKVVKELGRLCSGQRLLFSGYWDRFVFYLRDYQDKAELLSFCASISTLLSTLLRVEQVGGGIGVIEISDNEEADVDQLLKKLLIASEKSLRNRETPFDPCFYDLAIEQEIIRKDDIKRDLTAIVDADDGGLLLQYQPILDLNSNQICGFEALSRMRSKKLGLVSPLEFIPLAEETKLIIPLGQLIIRYALQFLRGLMDKGFPSLSVSINVSIIQLLKNDFVESLLAAIQQMRVVPKNVVIELTESIFSDNYETVNIAIKTLKGAGISVAIDDFGTGYSSLSRERELNVDCLKIDKYFIDKLRDEQEDKSITGDIISMAHKLGHCAIAEGVEDAMQLQYLRDVGCDRVQGYYISRPLDEDAALTFIEDRAAIKGDPSVDLLP
ncbi:MAG: EAL domain-containing protein [Christensenellales bacterium]